ncbi:MAG: A/G-specific adenine glycosylase [Erysipelothrix sp.]|nr:A/G-specific adenine glycosylase [Erysipelothrix sp.]
MNKEQFTFPLINWYKEHQRDLPFRKNKDPYSIWVSEIMAQQTQISTMLPYYSAWLKKWPSIDALSKANDQEVKKMWEGLGYYRRASNLLKGAQYIMTHHHGQFPDDPLEIREIPGIGDYTTGAIASIAFNKRVPAIDGNVIRVMSRLNEDERDFLKVKHKRDLTSTLTDLMHDVNPSDFNQGLMELGALICTPKNPQCEACPLNSICLATKHNTTHLYPIKHRKTKSITIELNTYYYQKDDQLLVSKDSSDGLMKGLLRLPQVNRQEEDSNHIHYEYSLKHVFSHRVWLMDVYSCTHLEIIHPDWFWIPLSDIEKYSFATAHKDIINTMLTKGSNQ